MFKTVIILYRSTNEWVISNSYTFKNEKEKKSHQFLFFYQIQIIESHYTIIQDTVSHK